MVLDLRKCCSMSFLEGSCVCLNGLCSPNHGVYGVLWLLNLMAISMFFFSLLVDFVGFSFYSEEIVAPFHPAISVVLWASCPFCSFCFL